MRLMLLLLWLMMSGTRSTTTMDVSRPKALGSSMPKVLWQRWAYTLLIKESDLHNFLHKNKHANMYVNKQSVIHSTAIYDSVYQKLRYHAPISTKSCTLNYESVYQHLRNHLP